MPGIRIFIFIYLQIVYGAKLNVPRILLPEDSQKASYFKLEVFEGGSCYQWRSSRPDIIQVVMNKDGPGPDCSRSAIVSLSLSSSSISLAQQKAAAFVLAAGEGETLYCDVVVSTIHKIEISVRTHEIYLDDVGKIEARAYDDQGNEFSTLNGLAMEWHIEPTNKMESDAIRIVSFEDSKYDASQSVEKLEKSGKRGDTILIEGMKTGSAKICVRFEDPLLKEVPSGEVRMTVIANIALDPPRVYLMPGSSVTFQVIQFKHGRLHPLPMIEAQQYLLRMSNSSVVAVSDPTSFKVTALTTGETQVTLLDPNLEEDGPHPTATILVAFPAKLKLNLLPYKNWVTLEHSEHILDVEIFDQYDNKIHPSDELAVRTQIASRFVDVRNASQNGTWNVIYTTSPGIGKIKASLKYLTLPDGTQLEVQPPVKATADIEIYQSIVIQPQFRIYPWDPVTNPAYEVKFKATGGGDSHIWASSNTSVATISHTAVASTRGRIGMTNVTAAMMKNQKLKGIAQIFVLPAVDLKIQLNVFEFEEKSPIIVPIGLYAHLFEDISFNTENNTQVFSDCSKIPFEVDFSDRKAFVYNGDITHLSLRYTCAQAMLSSTGVGFSKLTVSYSPGGAILKDIVTIATYRKLKPLDPVSGVTVLSLGASRTVVFEGGPLPWVTKPSGHFYRMNVGNGTVVKSSSAKMIWDEESGRKDFYSMTVSCMEIGETKVTLRVGNLASSTNPHPVSIESSINVICAEPTSVELRAEVKRPEGAPLDLCSVDPITQRVRSQSYEDLVLVVTLRDIQSRKFDNISSIELHWIVSDEKLAVIEPEEEILNRENQNDVLRHSRPKYTRILKTTGATGVVDVTVSFTGYKSKYLKHVGVFGYHDIKKPIREDIDMSVDTLNLLLVDDVTVEPKEKTIFNHPNNSLFLSLHNGSGIFSVSFDKEEIASFVHHQDHQTVQVFPVRDGTTTITIKDACLTTRSIATSQIHVASLERIEMDGPEKVALKDSIKIHVKILDTAGNQLSVSSAKFLNLKGKADGNFVNLRFEPESSETDFVYTVVGMYVGTASISFVADKGIRSSVLSIEVFAPLKIEPKSLTLIIGSTFQLKAVDGPTPDPNLVYIVEDQTISSVSQAGVILASSLGHTRITAKSLGPHGYVYSKDTIDLYVIPFNGVEIRSPSYRIIEGGELPLTAWGHDGKHTPFAFGSVYNQLSFKWSVHGSGYAVVKNCFYEAGMSERPSEKDFSVVVVAEKAGVLRLRVKVILSGTSTVYENEIQIEVIPRLALSLKQANEFIPSRTILMSMNSKVNLLANRKMYVPVEFKALGNITVDNTGLVRAGSSIGYGTVLITSIEGSDIIQKTTVFVEILPVAYMMLKPKPLGVEIQSSNVPTGYVLTFEPHYYDSLGRKFDSSAGKAALRLSRFDLTDMKTLQNEQFSIKSIQEGQTIVFYHDLENPNFANYLNFYSADGLQIEKDTLTIGDFICFSSMAKDGIFKSSGPVVLEPKSGIALILGEGIIEIAHEVGKQTTRKRIIPEQPVEVKFLAKTSKSQSLTNSDPSAVLSYPLVIKGRNVSRNSNIIDINSCDRKALSEFAVSQRTSFDCYLSFADSIEFTAYDFFKVKSSFDTDTGHYSCVIEVQSTAVVPSNIVDTDIILSATERQSQLSDTIRLSFKPAIQLQNSELHFSNLQTEVPLVITGVKDVLDSIQIRSSDPSLLSVDQPEYRHVSAIVFPVKLRPDYWTLEDGAKLSLIVNSPKTVQSIHVPVHVRLQLTERDRCTIPVREKSWFSVLLSFLEDYQQWFVTVLTAIITTAIVIFGSRWFWNAGYRETTNNDNVFLAKSSPTRSGMMSSPLVSGKPPSPFGTERPRLWTVDHDNSGTYGQYSPRSSPPPYSQSPYSQSPNSSFR
ncbi:nuclear pore membrane glycoprotein 210-like [Artemia franciscana]|uniref:nuclear pore membrane glycoprotein 210-like n=1 Tax=Artemia franciscana TaxID=6661 RepID=UPI0032DAB80C